MGYFLIKGNYSNYRFNLHAGNHEVIGRSTQGYTSEQACITGINSVKRNALAKTVDLTLAESDYGSRYEIYEDTAGEFRFRLFAANGEKILMSEGYVSKQGCKGGIDSVKRNAPNAEIKKEA